MHLLLPVWLRIDYVSTRAPKFKFIYQSNHLSTQQKTQKNKYIINKSKKYKDLKKVTI